MPADFSTKIITYYTPVDKLLVDAWNDVLGECWPIGEFAKGDPVGLVLATGPDTSA